MKAEMLQSLIRKIYDAALNPDLWDDFVLATSDAVTGTAGVVAMYDLAQPDTDILQVARFDPDIFEYYLTDFFRERDLWYQLTLKHCVQGSVFTGSELITDRELQKTPMYNEILEPTEGGYLLGCLIENSETCKAAVTISRPLKAPDFSAEDKQLLAFFGSPSLSSLPALS